MSTVAAKGLSDEETKKIAAQAARAAKLGMIRGFAEQPSSPTGNLKLVPGDYFKVSPTGNVEPWKKPKHKTSEEVNGKDYTHKELQEKGQLAIEKAAREAKKKQEAKKAFDESIGANLYAGGSALVLGLTQDRLHLLDQVIPKVVDSKANNDGIVAVAAFGLSYLLKSSKIARRVAMGFSTAANVRAMSQLGSEIEAFDEKVKAI